MNYFLLRGMRDDLVMAQDASRFESLAEAQAEVREAECACVVCHDGDALENGVNYPFENILFYTQECGWFGFPEVLTDNPWGCGVSWFIDRGEDASHSE